MNIYHIEKEITANLLDLLRKKDVQDANILLEIPRNKQFGDLSCNVALTVAKQLRQSPRKIAESIAKEFPDGVYGIDKVEVAGPGFVNFYISMEYYQDLLREILQDPASYGDSAELHEDSWHFEFVSANPTGPLNVVSARAASIGATLVNVFKKSGYNAHSEFYVNDGGGQIRKLGASVKARALQLSRNEEDAEIPEGGYHGEYVIDIARDWNSEHENEDFPDDDTLGKWAAERIRDAQEITLNGFLVHFDRWFRESTLFDEISAGEESHTDAEDEQSIRNFVPREAGDVVDRLTALDLTYEKDGALFFRAGDFGDSDDRVLRTSRNMFTYVVPDIAYHLKKYRNYDKAVNLLGPDHHGHILQLRAALKALIGTDAEKNFFHPVIVQQVNLKRGGEEVKMSKRAGVGVTLDELIEEVGVDAARFFFLRRKITSPLDFDIELARSHNDENPVYYVQYAHARICSILRQPGAFIPEADTDLTVLTSTEEKILLQTLLHFPWVLKSVIRNIEPHPVTQYLMELAKAFHLFYAHNRVIGEDKSQTAARLALCKGVAGVLKEGLRLIGVTAPEKM